MMNIDTPLQDNNALVALTIQDFEARRLPQALRLGEQIAGGDGLDAADTRFLETMVGDLDRATALVGGNTDLERLRICAARLCDDIRTRAADDA
jgi:hypothetical protein